MGSTTRFSSSADQILLHEVFPSQSSSWEILHTYAPSTRSSPLHTHGSSTSSILSSSWSPDGCCIASTLSHSDKIAMTIMKKKVYTTVETAVATMIAEPRVVAFQNNSAKNLVIGNAEKVVLYDISHKAVTKEFPVPSPVTALACNYNDQYIATGTQSGQIFLLNNITKQVSAPLKAKTLQKHEVTSLRYSHLRKSRLASSSLSGSVAFWDCNANSMLQQFVEHSAPCTGVALSPINETFAGSCGLDKKVVLYDIERNSVISKTIKTEEPLTAIEIFPDGKTVAVGTTRGKILIYDMRNLSCPVQTKQVHSAAVQSILCQPPKDKLLSASNSVLRSSKSRTRILMKENAMPSSSNLQPQTSSKDGPVKAPSTTTLLLSPNVTAASHSNVTFGHNQDISSANNTPEIGRDSFSSQVFSPLRDQHDLFPSSPLAIGSCSSRRSSSVGSNTNDQSGIFSPLREQSFNSPALLKTPLGSLSRTPLVSPLTIIREESPQKDVTQRRRSFFSEDDEEDNDDTDHNRLNNYAPRLAMLREAARDDETETTSSKQDNAAQQLPVVSATHETLVVPAPPSTGAGGSLTSTMFVSANCVASTPFQNNKNSDSSSHHVPLKTKSYSSSNSNLLSSNTRDENNKDAVSEIKAVMTAFPHALLESRAMDVAEDALATSGTTSGQKQEGGKKQLTDFQQDFLRGCVEEAMDDFCSDMRKHLWHIQYDSIRAFQRQKEEVQGLLKHYVVNENLVLENERLRRENEELKRYF